MTSRDGTTRSLLSTSPTKAHRVDCPVHTMIWIAKGGDEVRRLQDGKEQDDGGEKTQRDAATDALTKHFSHLISNPSE